MKIRASEKATRYLLKILASSSNNQLSSVRKMAEECGVSLVTMWKATVRLKQQNLSDVSLTTEKSDAPKSNVTDKEMYLFQQPAWMRVKSRLLEDLFTGDRLQSHSLPSVKELAIKYGTCFETMKKALISLENERFLVKEKRTYRRNTMSKSSSSTIVFISFTNQMFHLYSFMPRSNEFWINLQTACGQSGLTILVKNMSTVLDELHKKSRSYSSDSALGYIIWTPGLTDSDIDHLVKELTKNNKPISVIDEMNRFYVAPCSIGNSLVRYFSLDLGRVAGYDVGQFLVSRGHRNAVFFSCPESTFFSKERYEGVRDAFKSASPCTRVTHYHEKLGDSKDNEMGVYIDSKFEEMQLEIRKKFPLQVNNFHLETQMNDYQIKIHSQSYYNNLYKMFTTALETDDATVWVCASDFGILMAYNFLYRDKKTNKHISLIGFDNIPETFGYGISSYDFNVHGLIHSVIDHLICYPIRHKQKRQLPQIVRIPGKTIPRLSTPRMKKTY